MIYPPALEAFLQTGEPFRLNYFVWMLARNFSDNSPEVGAFWTGNDDAPYTFEGRTDTYIGAGAALKIPDSLYEGGTDIRQTKIGLDVMPESEAIVRGYDLQNAPIKIFGQVRRLVENDIVGVWRPFKGFVSQAPVPTSMSGISTISLNLVTTARNGTLMNGGYKSHASHLRRNPIDIFRRDAGTGPAPNDPWGAEDEEAS